MSRESITIAPPEAEREAKKEKEPKKRYMVLGNLSGQSMREYTYARSPEAAINNVAGRLQNKYPKISYLRKRFKEKAIAKEVPLEDA